MIALDRVAAGTTARLAEPDRSLASAYGELLTAYGLVPGQLVTVVAHRPMTVVVCDHVELAIEAAVARKLRVDALLPDPEARNGKA